MLDSGVLMRRAVRWVLENNGLELASLAMMDHETKNHFEGLAIAVADDMQYNQLRYFRPFDHQKKLLRQARQALLRHLSG